MKKLIYSVVVVLAFVVLLSIGGITFEEKGSGMLSKHMERMELYR